MPSHLVVLGRCQAAQSPSTRSHSLNQTLRAVSPLPHSAAGKGLRAMLIGSRPLIPSPLCGNEGLGCQWFPCLGWVCACRPSTCTTTRLHSAITESTLSGINAARAPKIHNRFEGEGSPFLLLPTHPFFSLYLVETEEASSFLPCCNKPMLVRPKT